MPDGSDMATHIAKVESMAQRLEDLGKPLAETEIVSKLLQLPRCYRHIISAWDNLDENKQTKENLIPRLLKEEKLEKGEVSSVATFDEGSVAFVTKTKEQNRKFSGKCFYCSKIGHKKTQCRKFQHDRETFPRRNDQNFPSPQNKAYATSLLSDSFMFSAQCSSSNSEGWLADTGAGRHMCNRRDWFSEYTPLTKKIPIHSACGHVIYGIGVGTIPIESFVYGKCLSGSLVDVIYVPDVQQNLISIAKMTDRGFEARFTNKGLSIVRGDEVVATGTREGERLYRMKCRLIAKTCQNNSCKLCRQWSSVNRSLA